jgi:hypothetical protein
MPGIFNDRSTELVFNSYLPGVSAPWIAVERTAEEMARSGTSKVSDMTYTPGIGWRLRSYMDAPGDKAYLSAASSGYLSIQSGAQVPDNYKEEDAFFKIPGSAYSSDVQASGSPMITAFVPAGVNEGDISLRLASDETSFPKPDSSDDQATMNRVFAFPGIDPWSDLLFEFQVPSSVISPRATFATFYFDAAPGVDNVGAKTPSLEGTGHYAGKLRGDGQCYVSERLENGDWKARFSFFWNHTPMSVIGELIGIRVCTRMWQDATGKYHGDKISIICFALGSVVPQAGSDLAGYVMGGLTTTRGGPVYNVPRVKDKTLAADYKTTVRIDLAQGCRAIFAVSKHVYVHTGYILDDYIPFEQAVNGTNKVFIYLNGVVPAGTSLAIAATDQDGHDLVVSSVVVYNTDFGQTAYASVTPTAQMHGIRVKVTGTANPDNALSPVLTRYEIDRSPEYQYTPSTLPTVTAPSRTTGAGGALIPAVPRTTINAVTITPQETDPGAENAVFEVWDLTGELDFLGQRNLVPVLCRTKQGADGLYANLFQGYVTHAEGQKMRRNPGDVFPAPLFTRWTLQCSGEWVRTTRTLSPERKTWGNDPRTGSIFKVTSMIRDLAGMTYPSDLIDVPDLPIQLLTADQSSYVMEANSRTTDVMNQIAADYLGGYIIWDSAAGDKGMLRLLQQKHAPYNNLAIFETDHPTLLAGDGIPRLPHFAGSYPDIDGPDGQKIKDTYIQAGTFNHWLEPAEGNLVVVNGFANDGDSNKADSSSSARLQQFACDVTAYNFLGLSPDDAGYPDGSSPQYWPYVAIIRDVDFKLGSQQAADWKCRRIFEKACFARFFLAFDAPLILVTDTTDNQQQRPRPLRYYDPVQVRRPDGSLAQFIVLSCSPSYSKDHVQTARYTLVSQANIDTIGAINNRSSVLNDFVKTFGRVTGANWTHSRPIGTQQRQGEGQYSTLFGLPTPTAPTIQDLDPASPTFGMFKDPTPGGSMTAFDAIPHA